MQTGNNNIVNNVMHISYGGANINITTQPNTHNNFIFNNTAPINLNFFRSGGTSTTNLSKDTISGMAAEPYPFHPAPGQNHPYTAESQSFHHKRGNHSQHINIVRGGVKQSE